MANIHRILCQGISQLTKVLCEEPPPLDCFDPAAFSELHSICSCIARNGEKLVFLHPELLMTLLPSVTSLSVTFFVSEQSLVA